MCLKELPYGIYRIDATGTEASNKTKVERFDMYEVDVNARVRDLCQQILQEEDPHRVEQLARTLRSTIKAGQEEARLRMSFVARHYRGRLQEVASSRALASNQKSEKLGRGSKGLRDALEFLGFGPRMRLSRERG
jgi:hypothetical protein